MPGVTKELVLTISPSPRGFAFTLFYDPTDPIDWGIKEVRGAQKNARCIGAIKKLLRRYEPDVVVIEAYAREVSRRGPRIRSLLRDVERLAERQRVTVKSYSRTEVRRVFDATQKLTRPEIARLIALKIPALALRLPPLRKIWMSEDPRQSLFDAAALGIAYYVLRTGRDILSST